MNETLEELKADLAEAEDDAEAWARAETRARARVEAMARIVRIKAEIAELENNNE